MFTELYREEKREEGDRGGQDDKGEGNQKERDRSSHNQFPKSSPSLGHTKRFAELGREEKGEGGDRGDLMEKKESQKGDGAIRPVISLPSKNGY